MYSIRNICGTVTTHGEFNAKKFKQANDKRRNEESTVTRKRDSNKRTPKYIFNYAKKTKKMDITQSKGKYLLIVLLRAGDIEKNPGPGPTRIPEPMILEELKLSSTLELPEKELYDIEYFNFEEFLLTPRGIIMIKEKLYNHIYSCPSCEP